MILALDPGNEQTAWVAYALGKPEDWGKQPNEQVLERVRLWHGEGPLCVEMIASYGMAVGKEVFETCLWIGRFIQAFPGEHRLIYRKEVKLHLCETVRANDSNIRAALLDSYGGKQIAIGTKKAPGPLYGLSGDCWSALAVAVTAEAQSPPNRLKSTAEA